jgi:hypothetical protein
MQNITSRVFAIGMNLFPSVSSLPSSVNRAYSKSLQRARFPAVDARNRLRPQNAHVVRAKTYMLCFAQNKPPVKNTLFSFISSKLLIYLTYMRIFTVAKH